MAEKQIHDGQVSSRSPVPLVGLLGAWLLANFILIALVSWVADGWYLGWSSQLFGMLAELGLIQLPNLVIPLILLRIVDIKGFRMSWAALGWRWTGWRAVLTGVIAFVSFLGISMLVNLTIGAPIPYQLPGRPVGLSAHGLLPALGLLLLLLVFVGLTTLGEENMFRGLIQTDLSSDYGALAGILGAALLFGLRHLPADLFYGQAWKATPQMWLAREIQLYSGGLLYGLARHFGGSTYASWIAHLLTFGLIFTLGG